MNRKRMAGVLILIVGVVVFLYSLNAKHRIAAAKGEAGAITSFLPDSSAGNFVSDTIHGKVSQYDTIVQFLYVGGIVLIVLGAGMTIFCKKKH